MTYLYIKLQQPSQLQKFWIRYLRGNNTFIINGNHDTENLTFDDIPTEHKSNCKKVVLGADIFPINKEFFNYIINTTEEMQYYITNFSNPKNNNELFLVHDPQLETIKKITFKKFTWFFNSELYNEIKDDHTPLDELHCLPTGFKANWILSKSYTKLQIAGATKNTKIFYYDFNNYMLTFKQKLINNWDGYDYPAFINNYGLELDLLPDNFNESRLEIEWRKELNRWGGETIFAKMWDFQKNFDYEFIQLNLFTDFKKIKISNIATCWFSNVFFYPTLFFLHPEQQIWDTYNNFMSHLKQSNSMIYIKDPIGYDGSCSRPGHPEY